MTHDRLDEIKTKWNIPVTLPMPVPWGKDDIVWLVGEVERLRAEAQRADDEATRLANSDLATTEQVIRALRRELDEARAVRDVAAKHVAKCENASLRCPLCADLKDVLVKP